MKLFNHLILSYRKQTNKHKIKDSETSSYMNNFVSFFYYHNTEFTMLKHGRQMSGIRESSEKGDIEC